MKIEDVQIGDRYYFDATTDAVLKNLHGSPILVTNIYDDFVTWQVAGGDPELEYSTLASEISQFPLHIKNPQAGLRDTLGRLLWQTEEDDRELIRFNERRRTFSWDDMPLGIQTTFKERADLLLGLLTEEGLEIR